MSNKIYHDNLVIGIRNAISRYISKTMSLGIICSSPCLVKGDSSDEDWIEADIVICCKEEKLIDRECIGAPDMVIEVVSSESKYMDYVTKVKTYNDIGVQEYWIINPEKQNTMIYRFKTDVFTGILAFDEEITLEIIPELTIRLADLCNI